MLAVSVTNVAQSLYSLLHAIDTDIEDHAESVELQEDPDGMAVVVYIGNSDVDSSHWGIKLQAAQFVTIPPVTGNLLLLRQIYLVASAAGPTLVGATITTR
jgi:hypothetical protein